MVDDSRYDAIVVGAGPNGLAAAIVLARAGLSVRVIEAEATPGGGARSEALTLPGFVHDLGSAVYPLGVGSPFFRTLPLETYGLEWVFPPAELAHPHPDGSATLLERSLENTVSALGPDSDAYHDLFAPLVKDWPHLEGDILGPLRWPGDPFALCRFGLQAMRPARRVAESDFVSERTRSLFAGLAAHSTLPLEFAFSSAFGLVLGTLGHVVGWPIARGGSQRITDALAAYLRSLGGEIVTGTRIGSLQELPPARAVLCDVTPRQFLRIAGERLPAGYRRKLENYRYGPGVYKLDWALDGPIPWKAAECARAATVHLGGSLEEIAASERAAWDGEISELPFVLLAQPSLFDASRAPAGKHTAWAYCHVPHSATVDMTARIEAQIERFAPGFRDRILARSVLTPAALELRDANLVGGDISGGANDLRQLFTRPIPQWSPYATPIKGVFLCSSSTPPGGGVHGLCGYHAAHAALKNVFHIPDV